MTAAGTQMARDLAEQIAELREQRDFMVELLAEVMAVESEQTRWDRDAAIAIARARRNP